MIASVITVVTMASWADSHSAAPKPGWVKTLETRPKPANRCAVASGAMK